MPDTTRTAATILVALSCTFSCTLMLTGCHGTPHARTGPTVGAVRVELRLATRGRQVHPLTLRRGRYWVTDVKLPNLVATNRGVGPVTIGDVTVEGYVGGAARPSITLLIPGGELAREQATTTAVKATLAAGALPAATVGLALGQLVVGPAELASGAGILPGKSTALWLTRRAHLHHVGTERLARLRLIVEVTGPGGPGMVALAVPLIARPPADYTFPLRGQTTLVNLAFFGHHRGFHSQEFGMDIISTRLEGGVQASSAPAGSRALGDYFIYGREVLAIADGVVVDVADRFPEAQSIAPTTFTAASSAALLRLAPAIGFLNAVVGNYLIIEHGGGGHAVYAHLQQGSLRPKLGDRVKQGEVIARVGSTGNSSEPHLHFQLQDGKDLLSANGLPVIFRDAPPRDGPVVLEGNGYWGSTTIHQTVK